MGFADSHRLILIVGCRGTRSLWVDEIPRPRINDRLTAARYTAARATHDFNEMVGLFSRFNGVEQLRGVGCARVLQQP